MTSAEVSVKKILVPVDGSAVSKKAAQYAIHIAKMENAKLVLMNVIEDVKQGGAIGLQAKYGNMRLVEGFQKVKMQSAEKWMSEITEAADQKGIDSKMEILPDDGTHEVGVITEYAKKKWHRPYRHGLQGPVQVQKTAGRQRHKRSHQLLPVSSPRGALALSYCAKLGAKDDLSYNRGYPVCTIAHLAGRGAKHSDAYT